MRKQKKNNRLIYKLDVIKKSIKRIENYKEVFDNEKFDLCNIPFIGLCGIICNVIIEDCKLEINAKDREKYYNEILADLQEANNIKFTPNHFYFKWNDEKNFNSWFSPRIEAIIELLNFYKSKLI